MLVTTLPIDLGDDVQSIVPTGNQERLSGADSGATELEVSWPRFAYFAEGFDTPDLKGAKALLDKLGN